ncbi:MAG TPA: hypothetical protein VIV40_31700 [Kofleriaceae bacterium]|jgi:hypothetical protein
MRNLLLCTVLAAAGMGGCAKEKSDSSATATDNLPVMTPDEVEHAIAAKEAVPVDCNGDRTRKKHGVVPGAILISDEEAFAASELPADKTTKLVFYCADPG